MYNRYIPQPDGSYRRRTVPDPKPAPPPQTFAPPVEDRKPEPEPQPIPQNPRQQPHPHRQNRPQRYQQKKAPPSKKEETADGFLRQLLPRDLDTGDLLVMALLLLMAGDCQEDKSTALLTLALYLFL